MTPREYLQRRNRYAYPSIGLCGVVSHRFRSSYKLDCYHFESLNSFLSERIIQGYLSIIYWGHISGKDNRLNANRAISKVRLAKDSIANTNVLAEVRKIKKAKNLIKDHQYGVAVSTLTGLPQLGFAFASKVCAFIDPHNCGVIDSVIVDQYPNFCFQVDRKGYVTNSQRNMVHYQEYCRMLQAEAAVMNRLGSRFMWRGRDGIRHRWRAVDIERALYG